MRNVLLQLLVGFVGLGGAVSSYLGGGGVLLTAALIGLVGGVLGLLVGLVESAKKNFLYGYLLFFVAWLVFAGLLGTLGRS